MRKAEAHGPPPTLFEVVHRGVEVADPSGQFGVADLLAPVEDADEPVSGHPDIEEELAELKGRIDPQDLLRLAARAEYNGNPPEHVRAWLQEQGVEV